MQLCKIVKINHNPHITIGGKGMAKDRLQKEEIRKEPIIEFLKKESMSIPKSFRSDSEICLALLHSPLMSLIQFTTLRTNSGFDSKFLLI